MISSNIYNLRRKCISNTKEEKDQSNSKSRAYTFNQNSTYDKDYFAENSPQKHSYDLEEPYQSQFICEAQKNDHKKLKYDKNKQNLQSSPSQLNRYLKEYQYNCYKLYENQPQKIQAQRKQPEQCFSSDKKLGIRLRHDQDDSRHMQSFKEIGTGSFDLLNRPSSNEYSAIANIQGNISQQLNQRIHSIPSKTLTFNDLTSQPKAEPLCSRQELSLIKMLRLQIDQLRTQIQHKNVYISALQTKLQNHLIQRIQVQKTLEQNNIVLQNKILTLNLLNQQILQKLTQTQTQLISSKSLGSKISILFSSFGNISSKTVFQLNDKDLQLKLDYLMETATQFDTYKKLIRKIHQMKAKIENTPKFTSSQQFHPSHNPTPQQISLQDLWRWLKKLAKQYEILKQRVSAFQNPPLIS